jgi:Rieske Fe-S protein
MNQAGKYQIYKEHRLAMVTKKGISSESLDALSPLDGIVLEQEKLAAYRDNDGELHVYSAVCTHLGCIVTWNGLEKSFDCPCHGSRFAGPTGKVINGPANDPIQSEDQK